MAHNSFKSNDSFLEKLAIGAVGTREVIKDLKLQGHHPIELERGSTGYKIWKSIKIKRIRVPDILCLNSGIRIESRAKTKLTISMSHSFSTEERGWDYGLKDEDFIALIVCHKVGDKPIDWEAEEYVQYIKIANLREAFRFGQVIQENTKGAEEGFESRLTWPCAIANYNGIISEVSDKIKYRRLSDNRTITLSLQKRDVDLQPLVAEGERIIKNQIIASVTPVFKEVPKRELASLEDYYQDLLASSSIADRYTAAKAFSHLNTNYDRTPLIEILKNNEEHIYVKLEAASALAKANFKGGFDFIQSVLKSDYLEHRLEAVIVLGELRFRKSEELLINVLQDTSQHEEIRSGAAWALGELNLKSSIPILISAFNDLSLSIRSEAAKSLKNMCYYYIDEILDKFKNASIKERPGISWALSKYNDLQVEDLISKVDENNLDIRQWSAYILGNFIDKDIIKKIEKIKEYDPELYFAITVLWKIRSSWIYNLKEY